MKFLLTNSEDNAWGPVNLLNQRPQSLENQFGHFDNFDIRYFLDEKWYNFLPKDEIKLITWFGEICREILDDLSKENVQRINNDCSTYLLIVSTHEAFFRKEFFLKELKRAGVSFNKVIVISSNAYINEKSIEGVQFITLKEFWESFYRYHVRCFSNVSFIPPDEQKRNRKPEKLFLSLNRNLKEHRLIFYHSLVETGAIDRGFVSFLLPDTEGRERYQEWVFDSPYLIKKLSNKTLNKIKDYEPKYLDNINTVVNVNFYQNSIIDYYYKTLYSLITESLDENFLTEKTFKAIAHSHPFFIVNSSLVMHNELKERGYYTFEDIFGVDDISTFKKMNNFLNEVKNQNFKKTNGYIMKKCWKRVEHNYNHFFNREICFEKLVLNRIRNALQEK